MRTRIAVWGALFAALALLAAACGGDDGGGEATEAADDVATEEAAEEPTDDAGDEPADEPATEATDEGAEPTEAAGGDGAGGDVEVPDNPEQGVEGDAIRIGWMGDVTGPTAAAQGFNLAGAEAATAYVNAQGGVLGRELVLDVRDDQYSQEQIATNYAALVEDVGVLALVHVGNGAALVPTVVEDGIPWISPPQTIDIQLDVPNIYNDLAHYGDEADAAVAYIGEELGAIEDAVVAVVHLEVPSGAEWNAYIEQTLGEVGGTYAGSLAVNAAAPDFAGLATQLQQMVTQDGVNFIAFHGAPEHGLGLVSALVSQGLDDLPMVGIHGLAGASIFTEGPPEAAELLAGVHSFLSPLSDCEMCATIREFVAGTEWEDAAVELNFADGWHEVLIAAEAMERAAAESGELTWESMNAALVGGPFDTGGLTCDPDWSISNHSPCAAVFRWQDDHMEPVQPFSAYESVIDGEYGLASS